MNAIRGMPVILYQKSETGRDSFNRPVYSETAEVVDNVLVAPATADDITTSTELCGKKAVYTLGIPKGDTHKWEDAKIEFFGEVWQSFGFSLEGIEAMIPLSWNKKIMVKRYG